MKRLSIATIAATLCVALLPAGAVAKGPLEASLDGPGLDRPIRFGGWGEHALEPGGAPLMEFAEAAGFFPAAFGQSSDSMLETKPKGELGPRYTATYDLGRGPDGDKDFVVQDVYPYAKPNPVTYVAPGQRFYGGMETRGGWFVALSPTAPPLDDVLVAAGLPKTPPVGTDGPRLPSTIVSVVAALALGTVAALLVRRRQPTAATQ